MISRILLSVQNQERKFFAFVGIEDLDNENTADSKTNEYGRIDKTAAKLAQIYLNAKISVRINWKRRLLCNERL
jgi:hypothetical protein